MSVKSIVVVPYDSAWPALFEQLRQHLWPAVHDVAISIEHVGSTSVPGLAAKPVLDIDIVIAPATPVSLVADRLSTLGYQHRGNLGIEGREAFRAPEGSPTHHLYVCLSDSEALANHLAIRDHLRAHPDTAARYGALKQQLAREFPHDIDAYVAGKTDLLLEILALRGFSRASLDAIERVNRGG
ncbi:MAG: GrpB family protein [Gemmatimonadaceae bacterium]|nr:GrpB family protein [Gemmatimonadaceae bacterium]